MSQTKPNVIRSGIPKSPLVVNIPQRVVSISNSDVLISKLRIDTSPLFNGRLSRNTPDSAIVRGPKIYNKNLPDVFLPNTPSSQVPRQKKIQVIQVGQRPASSKYNSFGGLIPILNGSKEDSRDSQRFHSPTAQLSQLSVKNSDFRVVRSNQMLSREPSFTELTSDYVSERPKENKSVSSIAKVPLKMPETARHKQVSVVTEAGNLSMENGLLIVKSGSEKKLNIKKKNTEFEDQIRKVVIYKKLTSNMQKAKVFSNHNDESGPKLFAEKYNPMDIDSPPLQLNELITLKKIRVTSNNGIIKRMLHTPTLKMIDVQEEPISELGPRDNIQLREWLNAWRINFSTSKNLVHIYWCFWNSPEGSVSIMMEPTKNGLLSDLIKTYGSLPEKSVKDIAKRTLRGITELHGKLLRPHYNIKPDEVMIDRKGNIKLMPGVYKPVVYQPQSGMTSHRNLREDDHASNFKKVQNEQVSSIEEMLNPSNYSQDVFDYGFMLLQCAVGDFSFYDSSSLLTLENVKLAIRRLHAQRRSSRACCLIHSEALVRKTIDLLKNKSQAKAEDSESFCIPLVEILEQRGRFSKDFEEFLCGCLKIDSNQRSEVKDPATHSFLLDSHTSKGPLLSLKELMSIEATEVTSKKDEAVNLPEKHLNKLGEALKVAFLNRNIKEKFKKRMLNIQSRRNEEIRMKDLANELSVPVELVERIIMDSLEN